MNVDSNHCRRAILKEYNSKLNRVISNLEEDIFTDAI